MLVQAVALRARDERRPRERRAVHERPEEPRHLESGAANPTLGVLVKVAASLQVRLEELLAPPRSAARFVRAAELPSKRKGDVLVRKLLPEPLAGLEIDRMALPPRSSFPGVPHTPGTREYLTLERGAIELRVAGEVYALEPGDVVSFRGDQRHGYRNPGDREAIAYSVIAFAPSGTG